jgi:hypothetical protein
MLHKINGQSTLCFPFFFSQMKKRILHYNIYILKLSVKSGKDGTTTPCLVTQGMRFQKTGPKKVRWPSMGA